MSAGLANVEFSSQMGGNANTDDVVNSTDFSVLRSNFGASGDKATDFNFDNVTNTTDFNLMRGNFGQGGATLTCP